MNRICGRVILWWWRLAWRRGWTHIKFDFPPEGPVNCHDGRRAAGCYLAGRYPRGGILPDLLGSGLRVVLDSGVNLSVVRR